MRISCGEVMMNRLGAVVLALILCACSVDPMEACMKQGLERKLPADGGDRGAYIKAREQVRMECERKLK